MSISEMATVAFDKQAPVFDVLYGNDAIIRYKRERVREHMNQFLPLKAHILELNAGTGEDALYFASRGHTVHATDISEKMQEILKQKIVNEKMTHAITGEACSYTRLDCLEHTGPYDHIFSNFAGLNCTNDLGKVLDSFDSLLKPGGTVTLVLLPKFCLWEFLLLFRGKFKTAFRRFAGKRGAKAHIEGIHFRCWYYNPRFVMRHLKNRFRVEKLEGLCTVVPPSYMEGFAEKHPKLFSFLKKWETRVKEKFFWRSVGDYYVISLKRNGDISSG